MNSFPASSHQYYIRFTRASQNMSGKVSELCDLSDILTMINPTHLSQLVLPEKGKVASTIDTLGINVMTYATNLINNQNQQVVSIKHLNADSPLKSLASLDILKRSELLERFDWNGKDVFGYSNKQAPDAVYECTLQPAVINGRSQKFLIFFESDQQSKDKERRKVAMKMWQATDVCRLHTTSELSVPAYTIRANLKWYHNSEYKNWQMSEDDIEKVYERTHRGGTSWNDLTADEKFEQKDKISKTKRRGHLEDILNAFLLDLCKSFVQVAYDMVQHTVNLHHKSSKKATMFSAYFNDSVKTKGAVWDLHVFIGNFYFQRKSDNIRIRNTGSNNTWFGESKLGIDALEALLDTENVRMRNDTRRITENIADYGMYTIRPIWSLKSDTDSNILPMHYKCRNLFLDEYTMDAVRVKDLSSVWKHWHASILWSQFNGTHDTSINAMILGVERVRLSEETFYGVSKNKDNITKTKSKLHQKNRDLAGRSSKQYTDELLRCLKQGEGYHRRMTRYEEQLMKLEDSDMSDSEIAEERESLQKTISVLKSKKDKLNAEMQKIRLDKQNVKPIESDIRKLQRELMKYMQFNHKINGMWYATDLQWLMQHHTLYIDAIFDTRDIHWEPIDHKNRGSNSLQDFEFNEPPPQYNFRTMTQREHFSQPWYKVITEPVMNVMENFFYDLIETLSWNSTKRNLDINMITLIDDVRRKRVRSPGIPLYRSHLHEQPDEPGKDLSKMSLTRICLKSLSRTLPGEGKDMEELRAYLDKFHVPHAFTFFRMIRCPNKIALQEISRQCFSDPELKKRFDKYLSMMPLGMQTEILYILTDVRTNVSRKQSRPAASDSDSDSVEIVDSRSPSPNADSNDSDDSDGGDDDDSRGQSPGVEDDSMRHRLPREDDILRIEKCPFTGKRGPTHKQLYDFINTSPNKKLYVWFTERDKNGKEVDYKLAEGWHAVQQLTQPDRIENIQQYHHPMQFNQSDFQGESEEEQKNNWQAYRDKNDPIWNFYLPINQYYCPDNPHGNWTILYTHVVTKEFQKVTIPGDGACLFRAIAYFQGDEFKEDVVQQSEKAMDLRARAIEVAALPENKALWQIYNSKLNETWEEYAGRMLSPDEYGTAFELTMLSKHLQQSFDVYVKLPGENKYNRYLRTNEDPEDAPHNLLYIPNNKHPGMEHYDVLIPRQSS